MSRAQLLVTAYVRYLASPYSLFGLFFTHISCDRFPRRFLSFFFSKFFGNVNQSLSCALHGSLGAQRRDS